MQAIDRNDAKEMHRLIDSTKYNVRKIIDGRFSLVQFAMLSDSSFIADTLLNRISTVGAEDFFAASMLGTPEIFRKVFDKTSLANIEIYEAGTFLLEPLTMEVRAALRQAFIADPIDQEAIEELLDMPKGEPDLENVKRWTKRMELISNKQAHSFLLRTGLEYELKRTTSASRYLLAQYLFPFSTPLDPDFNPELFARAFQQGRWDIVDALFRRNAPQSWLLDVETNRISDPQRALIYFVKGQILDTSKSTDALYNNRKWRIPEPEIYMPGARGGTDFRTKAGFPNSYVEAMGRTMLIEGRWGALLSVSMDLPGGRGAVSFIEVDHSINLKKQGIFYMKPNPWGYLISIPMADTIGGGEYGSVTVKNTGGSRQPTFNLFAKLLIVRDTVVIDSVSVGEELVVNRSSGPVWVCIPMAPHLTFGTEITFHHEQHIKLEDTNLTARIKHYQELLEALIEGSTLNKGTALASDADLRRHLVTEQLHEVMKPVIRAELIAALRQLAAQSNELAELSNYLYTQVTDSTEVISTPGGASGTRAAATRIEASADKHFTSLDLLNQPEVQLYIDILRKVEGLVWEFCQYYPKYQLKSALEDIMNELPRREQDHLAANIAYSEKIMQTAPANMEDKGEIIKNTLKRLHE